jgi:mannose/fructose-specific phosphotransferase system component IIA
MSEELQGVVVCHGKLARALIEAAESISGVQR